MTSTSCAMDTIPVTTIYTLVINFQNLSTAWVNKIGFGHGNSLSTKYGKRSSDGKTFYFYDTGKYSSSPGYYQCNESGYYYQYLAIK